MHPNWPETDLSVAERFLKGDENAFKIIYHSFAPGLLAYATTICGSSEQAKDILQDAFVVCWEKRAQIEAAHLGGWLIKVTKNMSVKAFRRNVLTAEYVAGHHEELAEANDIDSLLLREQAAMKIVDGLPTERKKIFLLSRIHQKSYKEIANELGISVRTVENQLSSALKYIRYQAGISEIILLLLIMLSPHR